MSEKMEPIVVTGSSAALHGRKVIIDLGVNGMIEYTFPEQKEEGLNKAAWGIYCKHLKITIEEISLNELRIAHGMEPLKD